MDSEITLKRRELKDKKECDERKLHLEGIQVLEDLLTAVKPFLTEGFSEYNKWQSILTERNQETVERKIIELVNKL